ncbi:GntR family transcriptional regulator [Coraliomargarita algicola]|uniref:GntR family transcriptional regulator n=1 Tax=Coraliomargarita algicola TaxID=3092156 RepID=A0ABZ0RPT4_9BACT|nr:GntR family transcriptional regulator [Coraliomargarita sp. J2-16]WPJ97413.1 GntR family transcriptional regulator [Coraliomargarita sp. J2-16]
MTNAKPLYLQIYDDLRISIRNQSYSPGDLLPSEKSICERYSASRPTVARALKMLSEEKLIERRAGFGTQVLAPEQSSLTAGLLLPQIMETEIFQPIAASIINAGITSELQISSPYELNRPQDRKAVTLSQAEQFIHKKVNGVFFAPLENIPDPQSFNRSVIDRLTSQGIQVVLLDRDIYPWPRQTPYDLIGIDNIEAGYTMANHLLEMGCHQLAFVSQENPAMTVKLRKIGTREALIHNGLSARSLLRIHYDIEQPAEAAKQLLKANVDGILCSNDATAASILRAMFDLGARIPEQIKVCGFDDVKYASLLSIPLTSYKQPCEDIGRIAVETMIHRIQHPESPPHRIALQGNLIARSSTARCRPQ